MKVIVQRIEFSTVKIPRKWIYMICSGGLILFCLISIYYIQKSHQVNSRSYHHSFYESVLGRPNFASTDKLHNTDFEKKSPIHNIDVIVDFLSEVDMEKIKREESESAKNEFESYEVHLNNFTKCMLNKFQAFKRNLSGRDIFMQTFDEITMDLRKKCLEEILREKGENPCDWPSPSLGK